MKKKHRGGRPVSNKRLHEVMREHKCSRTWAYKLMKKQDAELERQLRVVMDGVVD